MCGTLMNIDIGCELGVMATGNVTTRQTSRGLTQSKMSRSEEEEGVSRHVEIVGGGHCSEDADNNTHTDKE